MLVLYSVVIESSFPDVSSLQRDFVSLVFENPTFSPLTFTQPYVPMLHLFAIHGENRGLYVGSASIENFLQIASYRQHPVGIFFPTVTFPPRNPLSC